jgi:hypothetical protein
MKETFKWFTKYNFPFISLKTKNALDSQSTHMWSSRLCNKDGIELQDVFCSVILTKHLAALRNERKIL